MMVLNEEQQKPDGAALQHAELENDTLSSVNICWEDLATCKETSLLLLYNLPLNLADLFVENKLTSTLFHGRHKQSLGSVGLHPPQNKLLPGPISSFFILH